MKKANNNKYHFYVTEWLPNGTSSLVVTDLDYVVIDTMDEAIFGYNPTNNQMALWVEGEVANAKKGVDLNSIKEDMKSIDCCLLLYKVTLDEIKKHIAVSPVNDGTDTCRFIDKYTE